jgi:hypothetical protein
MTNALAFKGKDFFMREREQHLGGLRVLNEKLFGERLGAAAATINENALTPRNNLANLFGNKLERFPL